MTDVRIETLRAPKRDVVPVRHWGRLAGAAVVVLLLAWMVYGVATNPNFEWSVVGDYLFAGTVLKGLLLTLEMTAIAMVAALVLAVVIGVMRMSPSRVISGVAAVWVFVFRGVPLIVLLIFIGNLGLFFKEFSLGIPFTDVRSGRNRSARWSPRSSLGDRAVPGRFRVHGRNRPQRPARGRGRPARDGQGARPEPHPNSALHRAPSGLRVIIHRSATSSSGC